MNDISITLQVERRTTRDECVFAGEWLRAFADSPVHPRVAIQHAMECNQALFVAIVVLLDADPIHLHPERLAAWLGRNENRVLSLDGSCYRFSRLGRSWRLLRTVIPLTEAAG